MAPLIPGGGASEPLLLLLKPGGLQCLFIVTMGLPGTIWALPGASCPLSSSLPADLAPNYPGSSYNLQSDPCCVFWQEHGYMGPGPPKLGTPEWQNYKQCLLHVCMSCSLSPSLTGADRDTSPKTMARTTCPRPLSSAPAMRHAQHTACNQSCALQYLQSFSSTQLSLRRPGCRLNGDVTGTL